MMNNAGTIPEIYAAISLSFGTEINIASIVNELNNCGVYDVKIRRPKNEAKICVDIAAIRNKCFWELNDALSEMFSQVEQCLSDIKDIATKNQGDIYIDIAFYQYGRYPALVINGKNMKNICFLEANISIDPF